MYSSSLKVAKISLSLSLSFLSLSAMLAFAYVTGVARAVDTARVKKKGRGNCRRRYSPGSPARSWTDAVCIWQMKT